MDLIIKNTDKTNDALVRDFEARCPGGWRQFRKEIDVERQITRGNNPRQITKGIRLVAQVPAIQYDSDPEHFKAMVRSKEIRNTVWGEVVRRNRVAVGGICV